MQQLEIDDRVIWKLFREREMYVMRFEKNYPQHVVIAKRGKSGKLLKNTEQFLHQDLVELWSENTVGENGSNNKWQNRIVAHGVKPADQFQAHPNNWRKHPMFQREVIADSLDELGWFDEVTENRTTGHLLDGHERVWQALERNEDVPYQQVELTEEEEKKVLLLKDASAALAMVDSDNLSALLADVTTGSAALQTLLDGLASDGLQELLNSINDTVSPPVFDEPPEDAGAQVDRAAELQEIWQVRTGDVWEIESKTGDGVHRLLCGDSTNADDVALLMDGERAQLVHADPPYGMGKEKDGIANDNLYREKLDAFQMAWWNAGRPHVADNGSVYIWGNAPDLWRLWYCGGLHDSERVTLRNEIVWDKGHGQGMLADGFRSYAPGSERCLFFMLGEQEFSVNADNYWDGWEPIRLYLKEQRDLMNWDNATSKQIAGHSETSGCHWFDRSQWTMPTREVYEAWQKAARDYDGFKRDYDELKRDYDANRAYFDNTHDNMTDVWQFDRVQGEERWEHATPKPVGIVARIVKSSSQSDEIILDPFAGSGTTAIAAEQLGRLCRMVEISPAYCAVILERMKDLGLMPQRVTHGA